MRLNAGDTGGAGDADAEGVASDAGGAGDANDEGDAGDAGGAECMVQPGGGGRAVRGGEEGMGKH